MADPTMLALHARTILRLIDDCANRAMEASTWFVTEVLAPRCHDRDATWSRAIDRAVAPADRHRRWVELAERQRGRTRYQKHRGGVPPQLRR